MFEIKLLKLCLFSLLYLGINVVYATKLISILPDLGTLRETSFSFFILFPFFLLLIKRGINRRKQDLLSLFVLFVICIYNICTNRDAYWGATITSLFIPLMYSFILYGCYGNNEKVKRIVGKTLINYFFLSCLLAIIEKLLGMHLFEYAGNMESSGNFRSYAFGGHPLSNAVTISTIMNYFWIAEIPLIKKIQYSLLGFIALFCFNTRFAIVVSFVFFCIFLFSSIRGKDVSIKMKLRIIGICFVAGIVFYYLVFYTSFGGRLVSMGLYDDDSASARIQILLVFDHYSLSDFVWGMTWDDTTKLLNSSGIYGVINENPWLIFLFRFGYVFTSAIIIIFYSLFSRITKSLSLYEKNLIISPMLLIISSFNSIGVGCIILSVWILCSYAFLPNNK